MYQGVLATCGTGDAVIVPAPYWPSYPEIASLVGADPVIVGTTADSGYLLTPDALRKALEDHPNSKLLILCNPSNPTGGVYNREQLEGLAAVLRDYPKMIVLADEIYERLVYEGECLSFATMPGMFERTITVNGFSKAYAMTGMRLGKLRTFVDVSYFTIHSTYPTCFRFFLRVRRCSPEAGQSHYNHSVPTHFLRRVCFPGCWSRSAERSHGRRTGQ